VLAGMSAITVFLDHHRGATIIGRKLDRKKFREMMDCYTVITTCKRRIN
jgi:hypothetical protein